MWRLALEYVAFTFFSCVAVLQWAAARGRLKGLTFFNTRSGSYIFSAVMLGSSFAWFFLSEDRAQPGLEGLQQFLLFGVAAAAALAVTLVLSSLIKGRSLTPPSRVLPGLDALKQMTYFQALRTLKRRNGPGGN